MLTIAHVLFAAVVGIKKPAGHCQNGDNANEAKDDIFPATTLTGVFSSSCCHMLDSLLPASGPGMSFIVNLTQPFHIQMGINLKETFI